MNQIKTDFLVIGSGIAGLVTALLLADKGEVTILTKEREEASNSFRAQGGIAAAVGMEDSPALHREDTLRTGVDLCDPDSVDVLVQMGPQTIELLTKMGADFDRKGKDWALGREGAHSVARILHAAGDATGAAIAGALLVKAVQHPHIYIHSHTLVADLLVDQGECRGALAFRTNRTPMQYLANKGVVMAAGGCGQLFKYTTNDRVATGDGLAMAHRAGAVLTDMEFMQFHPTALAVKQNPMFLISEAVRGEGAILVNDRGEAFMSRYDEWKDLAPRDVVSRAIYQEMQEGRKVYLDARMLGKHFAARFPTIYQECRRQGLHPAKDLLPVTPAAHFIMGGIRTDSHGQTNIPRLYACGEVACTGVHGANRLASNSLLEGSVFAQRVAASMDQLPEWIGEVDTSPIAALPLKLERDEKMRLRIQEIMWERCGIVRYVENLEAGLAELNALEEEVSPCNWEARNLITTGKVIIQSALWREESRGGHYRRDFPASLDEWKKKHYFVTLGEAK
ncbi:L-aspartate oxidase [Mechercharimyces sp. CAU 1602]|uniref:L-aspartate oxidase n=1 Tax=Mechercharimyces sp. CAU 1602 TaxID=2973933 RepID=UPI0021629B96|nr:L-aspartate oxidase [Mechercharimyces sp. CAU 1602]MCS1350008.1 L-aspartate oxidase [Mechercharimyces sp. CAU 1602]